MDELANNSASQLLIGHTLLSFEKQDCFSYFIFADQLTVATEAPWRFISAGSIFVTSEDHGHLFGLAAPVDTVEWVLSRTDGQEVVAAAIAPTTGDLTVEFSNRDLLQFLQMSAGYEAWRLYADGREAICTGGGKVVHIVPA